MKTNNREHELIKEAFVVIKRVGWDKFSLLDLTKKDKIDEKEVNSFFKNKSDVIDKFSIMIDSMVESKINIDDFQISSKKDNLFELIMMRLEEMKIYKKSLKFRKGVWF